jgi:glycosyltransferase involved in cell wall biosynthesis
MTLYSTIWTSERPGFGPDIVVLRRDKMARREILRRLLAARHGDAVLLNGAMGLNEFWIDLLLGLAIRIKGRGVALVVSDATWHSRSLKADARIPALHGLVERFGKFMLLRLQSPFTHYCFLARSEVADFIADAKVDSARVHFTEYCSTISDEELEYLEELDCGEPRQPYIFSGGNSSRDYSLLSEAVAGTGMKVVVATTRKMHWPAEITAGPMSHIDFMRAMALSTGVAVVLDAQSRRSVGQQTYLNAMRLGRPVIVNEAPGVLDHLVPNQTAIVVPPRDPAALRQALQRVLDPANTAATRALAARGQAVAKQRSWGVYTSELDALLRQAAAAASAAPASTSPIGPSGGLTRVR